MPVCPSCAPDTEAGAVHGEQVEQRGVSPLDVVDDDEQRLGAGGGGEERGDRGRCLVRCRGGVGSDSRRTAS